MSKILEDSLRSECKVQIFLLCSRLNAGSPTHTKKVHELCTCKWIDRYRNGRIVKGIFQFKKNLTENKAKLLYKYIWLITKIRYLPHLKTQNCVIKFSENHLIT